MTTTTRGRWDSRNSTLPLPFGTHPSAKYGLQSEAKENPPQRSGEGASHDQLLFPELDDTSRPPAFRATPSLSGLKAGSCLSLLVACHLCLHFPVSASAQNFSIDWFTIDGGGGASSGGSFTLNGTIGQPDASGPPMTGGDFSLIGGFWSLFAVQTPDAPHLTIQRISATSARVSWPTFSAGFVLQQNSDLNTTNWVDAPQAVSDNGTNRFITVNPPDGRRLYRLFKP